MLNKTIIYNKKIEIKMAKEKDMVLVLGKGNETYQKLKDGKIYFNDIEECLKDVEKRNKNVIINVLPPRNWK